MGLILEKSFLSRGLRQIGRGVAVLALGLLFAPVAEAQSACALYEVQKGDSLRDLAETVYGDRDYRRIWKANRKIVGRNPNVIEVGMVLRLPCLDGALPDGEAVAMAPGAALSFVTASGYAPYTDEALGGRGLVTEVITRALARAAPEQALEVVFVNDWAAHLEALLPRQAFDASFPWTRPNCARPDRLNGAETQACANYLYSDPVYEIVEAFFSRADAGFDKVTGAGGFQTARICRPEGFDTGYFEELGLARGGLRLVQPATAQACFTQLMAGAVDLVALDSRAAERVLAELGLTHRIVENPFVTHIAPLRVALHRDNPRSAEILAAINAGLLEMRRSGEWASIVSEGLKPPAAALVN